MSGPDSEVAIVGAGLAGIATAYYLCKLRPRCKPLLLSADPPMALTSAQSGENYRNWWPHPVMTAFTNRSIDLMETIARETGNRIELTRRGYALATRRDNIDDLLGQLHDGYGSDAARLIRVHPDGAATHYDAALTDDWQAAPEGVDVLQDRGMIRATFPRFDPEVATVLHVRRAGHVASQQMGQHMLDQVRAQGGRLESGRLTGLSHDGSFELEIDGKSDRIRADILVNAAGPFVGEVAALLGQALPIVNQLQQKIAFEDRNGAIPRTQPFAIDLDEQHIDWSDEERALLAEDPATAWLAGAMPGGIHCRPEGQGRWIKLGWAYNQTASAPTATPSFDPNFPEIVLRGAARLNPALKAYYGHLPRALTHYGGYYTRTEENWPLIGPLGSEGAFVVGALSGFGTMAACAAGELCAHWIAGAPLPDYAEALSLARYDDAKLMTELRTAASKGVL